MVMDAAVFWCVPNEDLGEEVKAVIQLVEGISADETHQCNAHGVLRPIIWRGTSVPVQ